MNYFILFIIIFFFLNFKLFLKITISIKDFKYFKTLIMYIVLHNHYIYFFSNFKLFLKINKSHAQIFYYLTKRKSQKKNKKKIILKDIMDIFFIYILLILK